MVGWLVRGTVYLTRAIEYTVQAGRTRRTLFEWLFPLTGFRAFESGINCRILSIIAVNAALMFVAMSPAIAVLGIRSTMVLRYVITASQPTVFSRTEAGHERRESCHRFRLFLAEVAGEPFVMDAMFKGH